MVYFRYIVNKEKYHIYFGNKYLINMDNILILILDHIFIKEETSKRDIYFLITNFKSYIKINLNYKKYYLKLQHMDKCGI